MNKPINKNFNFLIREGVDFENKDKIIEIIQNVHKSIKENDLSDCLIKLRRIVEAILKIFLEKESISTKNKKLYDLIREIENEFGGSFSSEILDACHIIRKWGNNEVHDINKKNMLSEIIVGLKSTREIIWYCFGGQEKLEEFDEEIYFNNGENPNKTKSIINDENSNYKPLKNSDIEIKKTQLISWMINSDKSIITIPLYQRGYTWTEEQIETLFNDIVNRFEDDSVHYFGVIAGKQVKATSLIGEKTKIKIIDGQQRLTTSFLFICAIRDIMFEKWKINTNDEKLLSKILTKNIENYFYNPGGTSENNDTFRKILKGDFNNIDIKNRYYLNYLKFKELINEKQWAREELRNFTNTFLTKFELGTISFDYENISNKKEMEIFENLNSKGKELELSDLIKNFIFNLCSEEILEKYEHNEIAQNYNSFVLNELGNKKTTLIEDFFKTLIEYNKGSESSNNRQMQFNNLKETIHKLFNIKEKEEIKSLEKYKEFLKNMQKYVTIFYDIFEESGKKIGEWLGVNEIIKLCGNKKKKNLFVGLTFLIIEYLRCDLYTKLDTKTKKEIKELFLVLMKAMTKHSVVTVQGDSSFKRNILASIFNLRKEIFNNNKITIPEITKLLKEEIIKNKISNDSDFKLALINNTKSREAITWLLVLTEWEMSDYLNSGQPIIYSNPSLEHIMPQDNTKWINDLKKEKNFEIDFPIMLEKIGNYFVINRSKNSQASNYTFLNKKEIYKQNTSPLYNNHDPKIDVSKKESWTFDGIEKRTKALIEYICEYVIKDNN
ncbi:MAG: GmrSD restriction endonuclease domain-containing protein [Metamycoplasmataceae bacterium]